MEIADWGGPRPRRWALFHEGAIPTGDDVEVIRSEGLAVSVINYTVTSLDFLEPLAPYVDTLKISAMEVRDWTPIQQFTNLSELGLDGAKADRPVDLTRLSKLTRYAGPFAKFESLLDVETLEELQPKRMPEGAFSGLKGALTELTMFYASGLKHVPLIPNGWRLRELQIHRARELSLANLREYASSLESVVLNEIGKITDADALLSLNAARFISFDGCRAIDPIEPLKELKTERIFVSNGKSAFDEDFQATVPAGSGWSFPSMRRRNTQRWTPGRQGVN
jgi:hypothetical protein